jgi:hypothetical protein
MSGGRIMELFERERNTAEVFKDSSIHAEI